MFNVPYSANGLPATATRVTLPTAKCKVRLYFLPFLLFPFRLSTFLSSSLSLSHSRVLVFAQRKTIFCARFRFPVRNRLDGGERRRRTQGMYMNREFYAHPFPTAGLMPAAVVAAAEIYMRILV